MEGAGEKLKKIRLEKGISLEDVQKKTKIHLSILKSIEEDNAVNLSPIYLRGFLKIYCKFLGVEPADYISGYKETQGSVPSGQSQKEQPASFFKAAKVKLGTYRPGKKTKFILKVVLILIISSIVIFRLGKFITSKRFAFSRENRFQTRIPEPAKQKKSHPAESHKVSSSTTKQKSRVSNEAALVKTISSGIRLGILAKEDCWVTLKADGRIIFHSNLKRGKSGSWQAKDKMELSLSNSGVVELIVNGERISPLGKKGQSRKNIVITKEGLSVP